jgi:hypothetical protein
MKKIVLVFFGFLIALTCIGAKAPQKENASGGIAIMATTDDGRRVILMPNGTWQFIQTNEAPKPPSAGTSNRDKLWEDLISYFGSWKIDNIDKASWLIQTDYMKLPVLDSPMGSYFKIKLSIVIKEDCALQIDERFQICSPRSGCSSRDLMGQEVDIENIKRISQNPVVEDGKWAKDSLDYINKLNADLAAMEAKAKAK